MNSFNVTASLIRAAADELNRQLTEFNQATKQIAAAADRLAVQWEGDAATAFQNEQARQIRWFIAADKAVQAVESALLTMANRYQDTDHDAALKLKGSR